MERKHLEALRKTHVRLINEINTPLVIASELYNENVISNFSLEDIQSCNTRHEQVGKMLSIVKRCGPAAFDKFIYILDKEYSSLVMAIIQQL